MEVTRLLDYPQCSPEAVEYVLWKGPLPMWHEDVKRARIPPPAAAGLHIVYNIVSIDVRHEHSVALVSIVRGVRRINYGRENGEDTASWSICKHTTTHTLTRDEFEQARHEIEQYEERGVQVNMSAPPEPILTIGGFLTYI